MPEQTTLDRLKAKREERMRQGQNTAEIVRLPSDQEERFALIPLLEGEYDECLRAAANLNAPDNIAGASLMDRHERREVVCHSLREIGDYKQRVFNTVEEMMEVVTPADVNYFYDAFVEMSREISPSIDMLSEDEVDFLKQAFERMPWNDLSGRQVYALSRFLSQLAPEQLMGKSLGRLSTL